MKLRDIAEQLKLTNLTPELNDALDVEVTSGHASDLLSDVLSNAPTGSVLVTIQAHLNVVAVALHAHLAGVIFAAGRTPDPEVASRAVDERVALFVTPMSTFETAGRLYQLGLRGDLA
jgi:hypothetical protein